MYQFVMGIQTTLFPPYTVWICTVTIHWPVLQLMETMYWLLGYTNNHRGRHHSSQHPTLDRQAWPGISFMTYCTVSDLLFNPQNRPGTCIPKDDVECWLMI